MKRTWELAFSETAYFGNLPRLINILRDWEYEVDTTSNQDGDCDYIYEIYDNNSDCIWAEGDGIASLRHALASSCVSYLDQVFGKGKPQVIVGDAVKVPFPRSSHVRS
jgi:hypothetical protein